MFSLHTLTGVSFRGSLEELGQVHGIAGARSVRPLPTGSNSEPATPFPILLHERQGEGGGAAPAHAVAAYQDLQQTEQEHGPLYVASQIMGRDLLTVTPEFPVLEAWNALIARGVSQAPVLATGNGVIGLVSRANLLKALNLDEGEVRDVLDRTVAQVMTTPVLSADPDTDIRRIAQVLLDFHLAAVPIVDPDGGLVGLVSRGDILRAVVAEPPLSLWA
ncbi:MAG: CBS domain-containing protein [Betaproteobacteria bacterium]|nr:CBS domain-containing protein [Betaproteobacteria bacterium]